MLKLEQAYQLLKDRNISYYIWNYDEDHREYIQSIHPSDYLKFMKEFSLFISGESFTFDIEYRMLISNEYRYMHALGKVLDDKDQKAINVLISYQDITDVKSKEIKLSNLAYRDILTGALNRLGNDELLNEHVNNNENEPFALIFFDLDNFKKVNDIYGHKWGDQALITISQKITDYLPPTCHLARVSGDEFIVFIDKYEYNEQIERVALDIMNLVLSSNKTTNDDAKLTASCGIALYPSDANMISDLIVRADRAMYIAKKHGKAQYVFYSKEVEEEYLEATEIHKKLIDALKNDEFSLLYQPIYNLEYNQIEYYEVVPYWNTPKMYFHGEKFVHLLYKEGLIFNFDEWLIERCLQDINKLKKINIDFKVSMNISPKHLSVEYFTKFVESKLNEYQISGNMLKIEMVEFILQEDFKAINTNFDKLRQLGCEIIIDKFAINSSTISVISQMHFDTIKINKFFVQTIDKEYSSEIIFDTIYKIAKGNQKTFVAEGIENQKQLDLIKNKGCLIVQGDYLQEPKMLEEIFNLN